MINFIDNSGLWVEIRSKANKLPFSGVPALFLDRDGTIVEEVLYLHKPKEMRLEPDAPKTIKLANEKGIPVIIVTNQGRKTGAIRKTPLMKAVDGENYILVASRGGAPNHPVWYHNLKAHPNVEIRDGVVVHKMLTREIHNPEERKRLWDIAVEAFPPYKDYQQKTERLIPVFLAEMH